MREKEGVPRENRTRDVMGDVKDKTFNIFLIYGVYNIYIYVHT